MIKIKIREPIWKNKAVGIAESKIVDEIEVTISYKDRMGNKVFPGKYRMKESIAKTFPTQIVRGTKLRIIPIGAFLNYGETENTIKADKGTRQTDKQESKDIEGQMLLLEVPEEVQS